MVVIVSYPVDWRRIELGDLGTDQLRRKTQFPPHGSHLILEQFAERFDQSKLQVGRQTAHVVMTLDGRRGASHRDGLDHVRVERPLDEELDVAHGARFVFKHSNELFPDDFPLLLGVNHAAEPGEAAVRAVHRAHSELHPVLERPGDLLEFVLTKEPVVNEDAGQAVADRAAHQRGRHGGVHAA